MVKSQFFMLKSPFFPLEAPLSAGSLGTPRVRLDAKDAILAHHSAACGRAQGPTRGAHQGIYRGYDGDLKVIYRGFIWDTMDNTLW